MCNGRELQQKMENYVQSSPELEKLSHEGEWRATGF